MADARSVSSPFARVLIGEDNAVWKVDFGRCGTGIHGNTFLCYNAGIRVGGMKVTKCGTDCQTLPGPCGGNPGQHPAGERYYAAYEDYAHRFGGDLGGSLPGQGHLHQPLHSSDDNDKGGNDKKVQAVPVLPKGAGKSSGELHGFWDTQFVALQGKTATTIANGLVRKITVAKRKQWSTGTANDWAVETYAVSKVNADGPLPAPGSNGVYTLRASYVKNAKGVVADQLSKAGVRLAFVLNDALE